MYCSFNFIIKCTLFERRANPTVVQVFLVVTGVPTNNTCAPVQFCRAQTHLRHSILGGPSIQLQDELFGWISD
jgi:hypothetical protein